MTNYSRVPQEMMACGLPCVDLAGYTAESVFGEDGPAELSEFSPSAIADHIERLMDDERAVGAPLAGRPRVRRGAHVGGRGA